MLLQYASTQIIFGKNLSSLSRIDYSLSSKVLEFLLHQTCHIKEWEISQTTFHIYYVVLVNQEPLQASTKNSK